MAERIPNEEQMQVINETEQNILLFASAGTGKTFTVAQRVNHILKSGMAQADDILCLTFTTKASNEMRLDILQYAGDEGKQVFVSTIHGFCYQVLKEETKNNNSIYAEPEVIDEVDADNYLKDALKECGFSDSDVMESKEILYSIISVMKKEREMNGPYTGNEADDFQKVIEKLMRTDNNAIYKAVYFKHKSTNDWRTNKALYDFLERRAGEWAGRYCRTLKENNSFDFEDLICFVHRAMRKKEFRDEWQKRFKYIIVDEMQDTSEMEFDIIRCLFQGK